MHVKQGDLCLAAVSEFMLARAEEPRPGAGVRAAIVVMKRRNGRGAKGCRKVKMENAERRTNHYRECLRAKL